MTSRYDQLLGFEFPEITHDFSVRDTILYALGVGGGEDPIDREELRFVYEKDMVALPSMAVTLAYPGFWYRDLNPGLDFVRTVHASERFELERPLPLEGRVVAQPKIVALYDKGEGCGALVVSRRDLHDASTAQRLGMVQQTAFCRGDGGLGGPLVPAPKPSPVPGHAPDATVHLKTSPRAAMIYRLSGDNNPLHVDPDFAAEAGFDRPILHGLATYGYMCRALLKLRGLDAFMRMMDCRFTAPVFPGETIVADFWHDGDATAFRARVGDRTVIDSGIAEFG